MTSPTPSTQQPPRTVYADRAFRSPMGLLGGGLLLVFGVLMTGDALLHGAGRAPWYALSWLVLGAPPVIAFTLWPVVLVNDERMLVRNPFRTVTIPWARVEGVEAKYSTEVVADGTKYQLWSIPVSMRARKRADRHGTRTMEMDGPPGLFGRSRMRRVTPAEEPVPAGVDQTVADLRELAERHAENPDAQGPVTRTWAWPMYVPSVLGLIGLIVVKAA